MAKMIAAVTLAVSTPGGPPPTNVETVTTVTPIAVNPDVAWNAVRDVYAVDTRLVPGMVSKVEREGDVRKVTFDNGFVVTERIVKIDDAAHRITYAAFGGKATYHLATMEVVTDGAKGSRIVWRTEFLPAELRPFIEQNMLRGSAGMKQHLEAGREQTQR